MLTLYDTGVQDDTDDFSTSNDWHKPGLAEDRIELFRTFTDQLETPVSFISLHSGLWDLALFGRQDKAANRSTEIPLSEEQMDWWMRRMTCVSLPSTRRTWELICAYSGMSFGQSDEFTPARRSGSASCIA